MNEIVSDWAARIRAAAAEGRALRIRGGGSKDFYGRVGAGEVLDVSAHRGVVSYEPTELVVTVRGGTPLAELEAVLAGRGQFLAFEPPAFGPAATVGGCVAAGLSGPRRATAGALRDFVLGVTLLDGRGECMRFGGEVMKNVAGYDVARVVAGSLGTLGVLVDVSLKVLPRPPAECSLRFAVDEETAIERLNRWGGQPLPVSASAWVDGVLTLRLSGAAAAVAAARATLGGDPVDEPEATAFWAALREQQLPWFGSATLIRVSVPSSAAALRLPGRQLIEWGGALRWLQTDAPLDKVRERVAQLGGTACAFRGGDREGEVFHPLSAASMTIQRRLKAAFDPAGIFGPGRIYRGL